MGIGNRVSRVVRTPAFGLAMLTPIVLAGAVGAAPSHLGAPVYDTDVTPLAAVSSFARRLLGRDGCRAHQAAEQLPRRGGHDVRPASAHRAEFPWRDADSGCRAGRLPQCRADHGHRRTRLRSELEPARRDRPDRVGARQRRGHRRARYCRQPDLRTRAGRLPAGQRGDRADRAGRARDVRPGDRADAVPARHLVALRLRRRRRRRPTRRTSTTRPWRPHATCAAAA